MQRIWRVAIGWTALACADPVADDPATAADPLAAFAPEAAYPEATPGPAALRRLTHSQVEHLLVDTFGETVAVPPLAEPDLALGGLRAVGASSASFSQRGVESVEQAAFAVAAQAVADPVLRDRWVTCDPSAPDCVRAALATVGRRLWRRPLTDDELNRVDAVGTTAQAALGTPDAALEFGLATLLQSPKFWYRAELGPDGVPGTRELVGVELASRLAFLLWDSGPDDALIDAALAGALDTRAGLLDVALRLLDDPRAERGIRAYFDDQLQLDDLDGIRKDPVIFEQVNATLGPSAREETLRLLSWWVLDADLDFRDVMTTRETFLDPYLASLYGVPAPTPEGFAQVQLPAALGRAGLLGHTSFLASHAHQVSSSATLRGKAVRTILLCQSIPAPPVDVDTSIPEPSGTTPTLRDRVAEHLSNPSCAGCHQLTDPIGLGLENFDGIGKHRATDNGAPIDASGDLDGSPFADAVELGRAVRDHELFDPCTVQTLARYATGRLATREERALLELLTERFAVDQGHRFRQLVLELIVSPTFRRVGAPE